MPFGRQAENDALQHAETGTQNPQAKWAAPTWLAALRAYFCVIPTGNLIWETLHLPLYTIWKRGTLKEQAFAVFHCTLGDLLITISTLTLAPPYLCAPGQRSTSRVRWDRPGKSESRLLYELGLSGWSDTTEMIPAMCPGPRRHK